MDSLELSVPNKQSFASKAAFIVLSILLPIVDGVSDWTTGGDLISNGNVGYGSVVIGVTFLPSLLMATSSIFSSIPQNSCMTSFELLPVVGPFK